MAAHTQVDPEEYDLVASWLKNDKTRWIAGFLGGAVAGVIALAVAGILAKCAGLGIGFPARLFAAPLLGNVATEIGHPSSLIVGFLLVELVASVFGGLFAHFTKTNSVGALLAMGFVWGLFTWIFIFNLYLPSFKAFYWAQVPQSATFLVAVVYGISLTSVGFFDQAFRGKAS